MGIQIISISHKIAPLHIREMFAFTEEQQKHMMQEITEHLEVSECIVLSTCNRTEMYVYSDSESKGCVFNLMEDVLLGEAGAQDEEDIGNYLLFYHGKKAIIVFDAYNVKGGTEKRENRKYITRFSVR